MISIIGLSFMSLWMIAMVGGLPMGLATTMCAVGEHVHYISAAKFSRRAVVKTDDFGGLKSTNLNGL